MKCGQCGNRLDISTDWIDFVKTDEGEYFDIYYCKKCNTKTILED